MDERYRGKLVSVIIPTFNSEKYIRKTLDSVFCQTYENIEVVIVDDCSQDFTVGIVKEYMEKHDNIILFCQNKNVGAGKCRNKALQLANGQYIAFIDSDDIWSKHKIEKQITLMNKTGCPFTYTAIKMIDENDKVIKNKCSIKKECDYKYLLHNTIIATSSVVIDRDKLGDIRMSERRSGQDYSTWLSILRGGIVARGIDEAMVKYRVRKDSLSSNKLNSIVQIWDIQTKDEKICPVKVIINIFRFSFNAIKKYL